MIKAVHLTNVHPADDVRIFHKECRSLRQAGMSVTLIAPGADDGVVDNVKIVGIPRATSRVRRLFVSSLQVFCAARREDADIYHYHDPELFLVGLLLKIAGKAVVYDVHEDLPRQISAKDWIPRGLRRSMSGVAVVLEKAAGRLLDGIVVAAAVIADRFPTEKVAIVRNYARLEDFENQPYADYTSRPANLMYMGSITAPRGIKEIVRAMSLLPDALDARLILAGFFTSDELKEEVAALPGWVRVDYLGWQDRDQIASHLARARIGLHLLHPTSHYVDQPYGVKVFEFMAAGIPSILSNFPVWRQFVEDNRLGITADPLDPTDIAEKVEYLLTNEQIAKEIGQRARDTLDSNFAWSTEEAALLALYERILERPKNKN